MASRCFWPPEMLVPACSSLKFSPSGFSRRKSAICASSRTSQSSSSVASGFPMRRFSATVPAYSMDFCSAQLILARMSFAEISAESCPSKRSVPPVGVRNASSSSVSVVLPEPVPPITETHSPAPIFRSTSDRAGRELPGYVKLTWSRLISPENASPRAGRSSSSPVDSVTWLRRRTATRTCGSMTMS